MSAEYVSGCLIVMPAWYTRYNRYFWQLEDDERYVPICGNITMDNRLDFIDSLRQIYINSENPDRPEDIIFCPFVFEFGIWQESAIWIVSIDKKQRTIISVYIPTKLFSGLQVEREC